MAYTWTDGEVIIAEKLNQTGGGLRVNKVGSEPNLSLDKTYREIMTAVEAGAAVNIYTAENDGFSLEPIVSIGGTAEDGYGLTTTTFAAVADTLDDYPTLLK